MSPLLKNALYEVVKHNDFVINKPQLLSIFLFNILHDINRTHKTLLFPEYDGVSRKKHAYSCLSFEIK